MGLKAVKQKKETEAHVALNEVGDQALASRMGVIDTVASQVNKGYYLQFSRVADTDYSVRFFAFMEAFSDSYSSNFNRDAAFGRTDGIVSYQNTQRSISMSWAIAAHNKQSAHKNLNDVNGLINMLYPGYSTHGNQRVYSTAPLIGLKYVNLAQRMGSVLGDDMLSGYISSFTHTPDLEFGVFEEVGAVLPKVIRLTCTFDVIHENTLGFSNDGETLPLYDETYDNMYTLFNDPNGPVTNRDLTPGNPSKVNFEENYFNGFKSSDNPWEIDPSLEDIWDKRTEAILDRQVSSNNPWANLFSDKK